MKRVVATLDGTVKAVVERAAMGQRAAEQAYHQAAQQYQLAQRHFVDILTAVTGEDGEGLTYDGRTGEVYREEAAEA